MKFLLDTHTVLWSLTDDVKLSKTARAIIADRSNSLALSIVSAWELAIKVGLGKLEFVGGVGTFLKTMEENKIDVLDINSSHLRCVERLPFFHRDPFDRLLVATAIAEEMTLVTADENIHRHEVNWAW